MENIQNNYKKETFWGKMLRKNNTNVYEVARETNIPEDKVREIVNGERRLPKDKVDNFVKAIKSSNKKSDKNFKRTEAIIFFKDKDFKDLRIKFGYNKQSDLAKVLKVSQYTVSRIENQGASSLSTSVLLKFYDFFKDELNIKINKDEKEKAKEKTQEAIEYYKNWFDSHDLRKLIENEYGSINAFANLIHIDSTTIYKYLKNQINWSLDMYIKIYNALNHIDEEVETNNLESIDNTIENETYELPITNEKEQNTAQIDFEHTIVNEMPTREMKNKINYNNEPTEFSFKIYDSFTPEILFNYIITNCSCKNVVELYKLLDNYFKN